MGSLAYMKSPLIDKWRQFSFPFKTDAPIAYWRERIKRCKWKSVTLFRPSKNAESENRDSFQNVGFDFNLLLVSCWHFFQEVPKLWRRQGDEDRQIYDWLFGSLKIYPQPSTDHILGGRLEGNASAPSFHLRWPELDHKHDLHAPGGGPRAPLLKDVDLCQTVKSGSRK